MMIMLPTALMALAVSSSFVSAQTILNVVVGSNTHNILDLATPEAIATLLSNPNVNLMLFGPDNDAFGMLPNGTVDLLTLTPWQPHLACVLQGHVYAGGKVPSMAITEPLMVELAKPGYDLNLDVMGGNIMVNNIPLSVLDLEASNGIIHALSEGVLLPTCVMQNIVKHA